MDPLDADAVEEWIDNKKASTKQKVLHMKQNGINKGFKLLDDNSLTLNTINFQQEILDFINDGPRWDSALSKKEVIVPEIGSEEFNQIEEDRVEALTKAMRRRMTLAEKTER